uniref:Apolipoprotein B mRNA editing enzyme, catalytic polypeptide-like 2a n=1 Tax=Oncorhynchus tshawytscha TaxID=74940 RepID=A0A8C8HTY1_ONCTS
PLCKYLDRIDPFQFKFQFKNVEYSSGRNKTFLCYLVDKGRADDGLMRGYLEDEHSGAHAEQAFFLQTLPDYDPAVKYTVTWYMSSSPCAACAAKIAEALRARKTVKMTLFSARLFEWEEQEIQAGLNALSQAGCKLRMMKPMDFTYVWDTFVENNDLTNKANEGDPSETDQQIQLFPWLMNCCLMRAAADIQEEWC